MPSAVGSSRPEPSGRPLRCRSTPAQVSAGFTARPIPLKSTPCILHAPPRPRHSAGWPRTILPGPAAAPPAHPPATPVVRPRTSAYRTGTCPPGTRCRNRAAICFRASSRARWALLSGMPRSSSRCRRKMPGARPTRPSSSRSSDPDILRMRGRGAPQASPGRVDDAGARGGKHRSAPRIGPPDIRPAHAPTFLTSHAPHPSDRG